MKNVKFIFLVLISIITISPLYTFAESITNNNGVVISEEEYNNFLKIHTHEYIMLMNENEYERLKELNYSDVQSKVIYVETIYNPHLNLVTEREITKEEYESPVKPLLNDGADSTSTTAKQLTMSLVGGTTWNYVTVTASWKGIPATRSYDVIGVRGKNFEFRDGSQTGKQIYTTGGVDKLISYAWNGTNIKRHDNGFGISMNIVNNSISSLQLTVSCDVTPTASTSTLFGSYQHATSSVSLSDSQNYTLTSTGLGGVFSFPYSIAQKYDGMQGVVLYY